MSDDLVKRLREGATWDDDIAAADRIEELEAKLKTAEEIGRAFEEDAGQLRAKLAKAMEVAEKSIGWLRLYGADVHKEAATLAELKGQSDE